MTPEQIELKAQREREAKMAEQMSNDPGDENLCTACS